MCCCCAALSVALGATVGVASLHYWLICIRLAGCNEGGVTTWIETWETVSTRGGWVLTEDQIA
jgi:hypothetical protein